MASRAACRPSRVAAPIEPAVLCEDILDRHAERRADPCEEIDHEPDPRAITQTGMCRDLDKVIITYRPKIEDAGRGPSSPPVR